MMPEPVTRAEHQHVEERLTKSENQLSSVMTAVKSNADSIKRLDENFERSMDTLFRKVDQINARSQLSPGLVSLALVLVGGLLTFQTVVNRPTEEAVERHELQIREQVRREIDESYNRGVRDTRLDDLERRMRELNHNAKVMP